MDGNRRWAKHMNLSNKEGWYKGLEKLYQIIEVSAELGIENLTVFAFSLLNYRRIKKELEDLDELSIKTFTNPNQIRRIARQFNVRIIVCGDVKYLSNRVRKAIKVLEKETSSNSKMTLNMCISYGGRNEIKRSLKKIGELDNKFKLNIIALKQLFWKNLYTGHSPRPDVLIRTSGENRLSDFMIYQVSEFTGIYFHPRLWPDFRITSLLGILIHHTIFKTHLYN